MILTPDKIFNWNGLKVNQYLLTEHNPNDIDMPTVPLPAKPLGITIHNTNAISVSSNTTMAEQYTRACVGGRMNDVRVHFYVDDVCAWQNLPLTLSGWHAADGPGCGNRKTIAIEVIGNSVRAESNAVKLAAYLLNKYNLNVDENLFTHTHWLNVRDGRGGTIDELNVLPHPYKCCPLYIIPHWSSFKENVRKSLAKLQGDIDKEPLLPMYRVRKTWTDSKSQIGAYNDLNNAKKACKEGYKVFDENGNIVYPKSENLQSVVPAEKIDVKYRVYSGNRWLGEITNYNNKNEMGYAGIEKSSVRGLVAKTDKGKLKYRVHVKNGGWLNWISKYDTNNWNDGCAGIRARDIDAIQLDFQGVSGYEVRYRVSTIGGSQYLNWITGYNNSNSMGYAGIFGQSIDKIQIEIVKI